MFNWIKRIKWKTAFFTCDSEHYSKIKVRLNNANIVSKTKITNNQFRDIGRTNMLINRMIETKNYYKILVKEEDIGKAHLIINQK